MACAGRRCRLRRAAHPRIPGRGRGELPRGGRGRGGGGPLGRPCSVSGQRGGGHGRAPGSGRRRVAQGSRGRHGDRGAGGAVCDWAVRDRAVHDRAVCGVAVHQRPAGRGAGGGTSARRPGRPDQAARGGGRCGRRAPADVLLVLADGVPAACTRWTGRRPG